MRRDSPTPLLDPQHPEITLGHLLDRESTEERCRRQRQEQAREADEKPSGTFKIPRV